MVLSYSNGPERINFVPPEDLIGFQKNMDWNLIKNYADLFDEWEVILGIKQKLKS
jgi:hypothetical protein